MGVLGLNDLLARLETRTAETPIVSTVHHPFGSPSGPGLFHVKGLQLPAYIQNVAHAFRRKGLSESEAISRAVGVVRDWAEGKAPNGGHVHPDVQAAAAKAIAEWEAAKAAAHASRFNQFHLGAGPGGGEFTTAAGAGKSSGSSKTSGGKQPASHGPAPKGTAGKTRAQHKAHLLEQAHDDRTRAHALQAQLKQLEHQHAQNVAAAKKSAAAAHKAAHINPHAKHKNPGHHHTHPAHHHAAKAKAAASKAKSLVTRIADLKHQIHVLLAAAASLEAQAKRL